MMRQLVRLSMVLAIFAMPAIGRSADQQNPLPVKVEKGWAGALDGIWNWRLPDTPNGLHPTQSWHTTGSAPDGDIYIGGMDHKTNAGLYRIDARTDTLRYVGDARSASEAAHNWLPGETAQKFHTRPLWHNGKIYVATMDRSDLDASYLDRRGFHWYAYDPTHDSFTDLSASEPGGTAVPHGNLVTLASDPVHNVIYGAGVPTGAIYRYDVASGHTQDLGRPASYKQPYVYTGRVMWVAARGRLYFTASNGDEPAVHDHVHFYDPETGFGEEKDWQLKEGMALETGQCMEGGNRCVFGDDRGHVYRFDQDAHTWTYLGQVETGKKAGWGGVKFWLFAPSADGKRAYIGTSTSSQPSEDTTLYQFDFASGRTQRLCTMAELDPVLDHLHVHTGFDAWDAAGRFYFASFDGSPEHGVIITRIDPARFEAELVRRAWVVR
ncbi:SMP-30/gluconolactonase/LRE family protein [Methylobacterium sp. E-065]|uniref:SMP-30/gluconolactonase/LRE family protein n=1 Tax=Methylobacterium sp. E-065 TaxID=2836583 RepID=UPI001FBA509A|nr:SMP-30/gluconolactonase/LRE family protein [Methylobacterium sp. E-065]MCJ2020406.1 SMP-30/gluconolactonase/LRE family protein [Methylobacterium sp. E-065]